MSNQESSISEEYQESISSMLESILSENLVESTDTFNSILSTKIAKRLEETKIKVAMSLVDNVNEEADEDEEDKKDKEFKEHHPIGQLLGIESDHVNKLTSDEALEKNADGSVDKRSLRAYNDRLAKQGSSTGVRTFKHDNKEESDVDHHTSKTLLANLQSSAIKPEDKEKLLHKMRSSKEGFNKVAKSFGTHNYTGHAQSIYGEK